MRVVKLHRYGVRTYPLGEGRLALEAPGKPRLEIAKPLEVTDEIWGPQELLIGSLASCFELTALAIARRRGVPIHAIRTDATGHVQSKDGSLAVRRLRPRRGHRDRRRLRGCGRVRRIPRA